MKIYWTQNHIPALKGLSRQEREAAKRAVIRKVWSHWQVWLPFVAQISAYVVFLLFVPRFPFRFLVVMIGILITLRLAVLPFNHYLAHYLENKETRF